MKKTFRRFKPHTAEYVIAHAAYMASRGRNPSTPFMGIKDPRAALLVAREHLSNENWVQNFNIGVYFLDAFTVSEDGWLISRRMDSHVLRELRLVSAGKVSQMRDNSRFFKADLKFADELVFHYSKNLFGIYDPDSELCAYLIDGTPVPLTAHTPFAYVESGEEMAA